MFSTANVGTADRVVRILLGIALAAYAYTSLASPWSWVAYAVAAILILTALVRFCPAYALFGASTSGKSGGGKSANASTPPSDRPSGLL
ncbi:YgaP family membrane protein [Aurantimonas marina]|uniref:YgaP family membrane protein n=1 Tax=Aurantimonas marina TaxID=2780508 RepID=UPI0019D085F4|nr:DUF2892 domain-containing protein [Aurantimonas marina]